MARQALEEARAALERATELSDAPGPSKLTRTRDEAVRIQVAIATAWALIALAEQNQYGARANTWTATT